jgi:PBP1b-binding outer membrane lipoprotein LpoB
VEQVLPRSGGVGGSEEVGASDTMYTLVNKRKNDKIKGQETLIQIQKNKTFLFLYSSLNHVFQF